MGILHMCMNTQRYTNSVQDSYPSSVCRACSVHECRNILVSDVHTFHMQGNIQTVCTEGFVALFDDGWNSLVVAPTHWTDTPAHVVCRQVGYGGGVVPSDTSGYRWMCRWFIQLHSYVIPSAMLVLLEAREVE